MRFLVTGLPRIRSAWLSAIFLALGVDTCHEYSSRFESLGALRRWLYEPGLKGWCDPSAACLLPVLAAVAFDGCPIVIIERDAASSRSSLERWYGAPLPRFDAMTANLETFKHEIGAALSVPYADLENYETVARIVGYCTGLKLPYQTWRAFDLLRIDQHMPKAKALHAVAA